MSDQSDYEAFRDEYGFSEGLLSYITQRVDDMMSFPVEYANKFALKDSPIHGFGMFANQTISDGDTFAPARIDGYRTPGGRFVNHAKEPNSKFIISGKDLYLLAIRDIQSGEEITLDYRQALMANLESLA